MNPVTIKNDSNTACLWKSHIKGRFIVREEVNACFVQYTNSKEYRDRYDIYDDITFKNCEFPTLPTNLGFPYLKVLQLSSVGLNTITNEALQNLPHLQEFYLEHNEHQLQLPGDLFNYNKNLREVTFRCNNFSSIGENLLDGLYQLAKADFSLNNMIDAIYDKTVIDLKQRKKHVTLDKLKGLFNGKEFENKSLILPNIFKPVLASEQLKDFTIILDEGKLDVHRFLLAAHSSTIRDLFVNNSEARNMILSGLEMEACKKVIEFIYENKIPKAAEDMFGVLKAVGKLQIDTLKPIIEKEFASSVTADNCYDILVLCNTFNFESLKDEAFKALQRKIPEKRFYNEWKNDPEMIKKLLEAKQKIIDATEALATM